MRFAKSIYFCNTARGELVILSALVSALKAGKVKGACLDVLENEKITNLNSLQKLDFDYLINQKNVLLTPHIAGWTFESYNRINMVLKDKIRRYLNILH